MVMSLLVGIPSKLDAAKSQILCSLEISILYDGSLP